MTSKKTERQEMPYGPGHPSYVAPLPDDLVEQLRGREFDGLFDKSKTPQSKTR